MYRDGYSTSSAMHGDRVEVVSGTWKLNTSSHVSALSMCAGLLKTINMLLVANFAITKSCK